MCERPERQADHSLIAPVLKTTGEWCLRAHKHVSLQQIGVKGQEGGREVGKERVWKLETIDSWTVDKEMSSSLR